MLGKRMLICQATANHRLVWLALVEPDQLAWPPARSSPSSVGAYPAGDPPAPPRTGSLLRQVSPLKTPCLCTTTTVADLSHPPRARNPLSPSSFLLPGEHLSALFCSALVRFIQRFGNVSCNVSVGEVFPIDFATIFLDS